MKITPPKQITFWIAIVLAVLGLLGQFVSVLAPFSFWLVLAGFVLLVLGLLIEGL
jgi:hypothetical protein